MNNPNMMKFIFLYGDIMNMDYNCYNYSDINKLYDSYMIIYDVGSM